VFIFWLCEGVEVLGAVPPDMLQSVSEEFPGGSKGIPFISLCNISCNDK
jgi:hypothetical protein